MHTRTVYDDGTQILRRDHFGQWWLVVQHCVLCGKCCMDVAPNWQFGINTARGCCIFLSAEDETGQYPCSLSKAGRPFRCSGNSPFNVPEYCSVRMEKISDAKAVEILLGVKQLNG